jgi:hypothetical protein
MGERFWLLPHAADRALFAQLQVLHPQHFQAIIKTDFLLRYIVYSKSPLQKPL